MSAVPAAAFTVAPEAITMTWVVAGGIIAELLILVALATLHVDRCDLCRQRARVRRDQGRRFQ